MLIEPTSLTWIIAARDRAERSAAKLRSLLEGEPGRKHTEEILLEAEDELRAAAEHCADSVRSLRREATR